MNLRFCHNMLGNFPNLRRFLHFLAKWTWLAVLLASAFVAQSWNRGQVFVGNDVYFTEGDCYAQMTRVQMTLAHPLTPIKHHDFENYPDGITPHTTAPFDELIALLAWLLRPFSHNATDLAGALVSPLLGVATVAFLWWWAGRMRLPFRNAMLLVIAFSPILVHGFELGRPRHQSLIILLLAIALAAEWTLWSRPSRRWAIASAAAWGLGLWVSQFEPLILLIAVFALRLALKRRLFLSERPLAPVITFAVILAAYLLHDGWRSGMLAPGMGEYFAHWITDIGELRHSNSTILVQWMGWLLPLAPILLAIHFFQVKSREALAQAILILLFAALTYQYQRWGYYLALVFAMSLPWALATIRWRWAAWLLFAITLWPVAQSWDGMLFPDEETHQALEENRKENLLLRQAATALISPHETPVLAPWWLCPAIRYWSGQPCIAGTSHESLPGTVDSARFYLATDVMTAREILTRRKIACVFAYEPGRILSNSAKILGRTSPSYPLGLILYNAPRSAPSLLQMVYQNEYFKIYEVETPPRNP